MHDDLSLELEIAELEAKGRPGCTSSSTSNRCTCPVILVEDQLNA